MFWWGGSGTVTSLGHWMNGFTLAVQIHAHVYRHAHTDRYTQKRQIYRRTRVQTHTHTENKSLAKCVLHR